MVPDPPGRAVRTAPVPDDPTITPVDAFQDLLDANAAYTEGFALGDLAAPPRRKLAVVTCMDCRIDPLAILGLEPGDAHVMRNAGARVTADVLRSLVKSVLQLGVNRVAVMHHTDCGAAKIVLSELRAVVTDVTGNDPVDVEFHLIDDPQAALVEDIEALRVHPFLPDGLEVIGLRYDVATGAATPEITAVVGS
jgi:carbonic anhydrase